VKDLEEGIAKVLQAALELGDSYGIVVVPESDDNGILYEVENPREPDSAWHVRYNGEEWIAEKCPA
jgi:hypothetical protein